MPIGSRKALLAALLAALSPFAAEAPSPFPRFGRTQHKTERTVLATQPSHDLCPTAIAVVRVLDNPRGTYYSQSFFT